MKKEVAVVIPTTGSKTLKKTLISLFEQTYENIVPIVVTDGNQYDPDVFDIFEELYQEDYFDKMKTVVDNSVFLPNNVGANGFYGQRIYAAFSYLINQDYIMFLDQDNWFEKTHVESMINKLEETDSDWVYSLRNIYSKDEEYLMPDNCESLGRFMPYTDYRLVDNNCYCFTKETLVKISPALYGGWGQDRVLYSTLEQYFPKFECTGEYTVSYRLEGNTGSVTKEFFEHGNMVVEKKYNGNFPWRKQ